MSEARKFFLIAIAVGLGLVLLFNIGSFTKCGKRENLQYLKQYEQQDAWRNSTEGGPGTTPIWPVDQIPAAANYEIRREIGLSSY